MSYPKWICSYSQFGKKGFREKQEKAAYSFELKLHGVKLYLNKRAVPSRTVTSGWPGGLAAITRWGTDVSEKIHQERYSRNNWIFEIHIVYWQKRF